MHEVVTLQIGEQANYLATHFWNTQESYFTYDERQDSPVDHNVHFQPGIAAEGSDTFTPRTLIYDFKPNFGTLRRVNELYDALGQDDGAPAAQSGFSHRQPPIPPHPFQRALSEGTELPNLRAETVRYWSDYNRVFYHPQSISQVYEDRLEPQQKSFAQWQDGEALFDSLNKEVDLLDDELRPLIERCDQMQGLQMLTGSDDGWGGFASRYLDAIRDEYDRSTIIVWGLNAGPPESVAKRALWNTSQAQSLFSLSDRASVYVPMTAAPKTIPEIMTDPSRHTWFTSAVQALAFEPVLLPTRLLGTSVHLNEIAEILTAEPGQKVVEARFDVLGSQDHTLNGANGHFEREVRHTEATCQLLPHSDPDAEDLDGSVQMLRGEDVGATPDENFNENDPQTKRFYCNMPFPVVESFPGLRNGAKSLKLGSALSKSSAIASWSSVLQSVVARQVGIEDREELLDGLSQIRGAYAGDGEGLYDSDD